MQTLRTAPTRKILYPLSFIFGTDTLHEKVIAIKIRNNAPLHTHCRWLNTPKFKECDLEPTISSETSYIAQRSVQCRALEISDGVEGILKIQIENFAVRKTQKITEAQTTRRRLICHSQKNHTVLGSSQRTESAKKSKAIQQCTD